MKFSKTELSCLSAIKNLFKKNEAAADRLYKKQHNNQVKAAAKAIRTEKRIFLSTVACIRHMFKVRRNTRDKPVLIGVLTEVSRGTALPIVKPKRQYKQAYRSKHAQANQTE